MTLLHAPVERQRSKTLLPSVHLEADALGLLQKFEPWKSRPAMEVHDHSYSCMVDPLWLKVGWLDYKNNFHIRKHLQQDVLP